MYPNLTPSLLALLVLAAGASVYIALRRPVLRRLALRQVVRRRREATLVILGSMLGTAIIVGSLVVGDTLNFSVKQAAYEHLGPIDETVMSTSLADGRRVADRLAPLRRDAAVDGMLTVHGDVAAVTLGGGADRVAEPRVGVWDVDFSDAAAFGSGEAEDSGLKGTAPPPGQVVINTELADALGAKTDDALTFYLYGRPVEARVARVVPTRGVAGVEIDGVTRAAFFAPETLVRAAKSKPDGPRARPRTFTFVSNAGDVEGGNERSDEVTAKIDDALGSLTASGTSVEKSKQIVLADAKKTGDSLGSMFLMIGSFAIIAGVLLLVNIFVMLADERKPELGMLRAVGMKRSRLVRSFIIEGTVYALAASLLGVVVGIGVGRAVGALAVRISSGFSGEAGLHLAFHVTRVSLVNGFTLGFLIALATVTLTSLRISRINIIAAIRDLPLSGARPMRRRWVALSTILAALFGALSIPAIAASDVGALVYPALTAVCLAPLLVRFAPRRWVYSGIAVAVLVWTLTANIIRPQLLSEGGTAVFIIVGVLLMFSAVVLLSQNQGNVAVLLRPLVARASQFGLSTRVAVAYPLAKRFRTGAILIMYGLVIFTLVFITVLSALVQNMVTDEVRSASGAFALRADLNPAAPLSTPVQTLASGRFVDEVGNVAPLFSARGVVTELDPVVPDPVDIVVVGIGRSVIQGGGFSLAKRAAAFESDESAWSAVLSDPNYVIVDDFLGQLDEGGPPQNFLHAGGTFTLTDPLTGKMTRKTVAGTLDSSYGFYGMGGGVFSPVIMGKTGAEYQFGAALRPTSFLIEPTGQSPEGSLATSLQGEFLRHGLIVTSIRQTVEDNYAASRGFFQLMQGFVALGLLVGIAGLGVVMIRAVRERRRDIGVLRALGFQAKTVHRAFVIETVFVTLEGVMIGTILSVVTTYQVFQNYEVFRRGGGFSIPWALIAVLVVGVTLASALATMWPARRASQTRPAVALRIAD